MEVKINREIRNYNETMFFGLSMRQFFFALAALGIAVLLYFLLKDSFGVETVSWMCILGAAPFAVMGFVTYHGMTAEQFIWAWFRSELLEPKVLFVKHGLRPIRFHDLRHSCASLLLANGVNLKDIQSWLGHSTISTTANIYVYQEFASKISSANAILQILPEMN